MTQSHIQTQIPSHSKPKPPVYSDEQLRIFNIKSGFNIVSANSGVGKTECCAEFILRSYLAEEKKTFPQIVQKGGHVSGQEQMLLLRQFIVVTFTVKAAAELNERIKRKFKAASLPWPEIQGKEYRICRTLDSLLQRWFYHPMLTRKFFSREQQWQKEISDRWQHVLKSSPQAKKWSAQVLEARAKYGNPEEQLLSAWLAYWNPLIGENISALLQTMAVQKILPAPNCPWPEDLSEDRLERELLDYLAKADFSRSRISAGFWEKIEARFVTSNAGYKKQEQAYYHPQTSNLERVKIQHALAGWWKRETLRQEFSISSEVARSYGYDPTDNPEALGLEPVFESLSGNKELLSVKHLHQIAKEYARLKRKFMAFDFRDFLHHVQKTFVEDPGLLEKNIEYPRLGFRGKYVVFDEAQDHDGYQYSLMTLLSGGSVPFVTLGVGDIKQSIYVWRGAQPHEFLRFLKHLEKTAPQNIYHLTCSFRSARAIVRLGNSIAKTLPSYRNSVKDSTTVYRSEGLVQVLPPQVNQHAEAESIQKAITKLRAEDKQCSIMVLWRSNGWHHPLASWCMQQADPNLWFMSIHQSKGLEADHVFLLSCSAGIIPDIRADSDQEANLFYVACTRARSTLTLSCVTTTNYISPAGYLEQRTTGPSPYIARVPEIKAAALKSGWTAAQLEQGIHTHTALRKAFEAEVEINRQKLEKEFAALNLSVEKLARDLPSTGAAPKDGRVTPIWDAPEPKPFVQEEPTDTQQTDLAELMQKCLAAYPKMPFLPKHEFMAGLRAGWWAKNGSNWEFTSTFHGLQVSQKNQP
jgi:superfamily I DNA/RNA helicase